ncbi:inositol monophosphatase family protein [Caballeronia sordidicola]|uniref:inositol-phosphate phosphatase n=1 Tax=Caballeronia sordidicola TaxID=196367 RepID=A0A242N5R8_CABSO|nr:inositol monophosphatase family protein [Caballeronia sordidicola]OTP79015.1 Inositol-1-monophosphatase [Caballeronia sordidicola]
MAEDGANNISQGQVLTALVEKIARNAGDIALSYFRSLSTLSVKNKGHLDLVTEADRDVETYLTASMLEAFPDDGVFGEEGGDITGRSGRIWVIDPIDGTFNFVRGGQNWAISIGLYEHHRPVFGVIYVPVRDLMLSGGNGIKTKLNGKPMRCLPPLDQSSASTGLGLHPSILTEERLEVLRFISDELRFNFRVCGSATLSLIEVAMGETDGYVSLGDSTWDVMAALPILANLGARHTIDWNRTDLDEKLRFACGSEAFLAKVRPLLARVGGKIVSSHV